MKWLDGITDSMDMSMSKLSEMVKDRKAWHATVNGSQRAGHDLATEQDRVHFPPGASWIFLCVIAIKVV